jgi:fumarylacetoacetate (FAA) hydrolase
MYQGGSDDLLGPCDPVVVPSEAFGIDFEAEIAVITGDVPMGVTPEQALDGIRLVMLVNDVSLRNLIPDELAKGFGFFQSKPATAFSPVAVTPDELGDAWQGGRVHLTLQSTWNGRKVGICDAGPEMTFHFGQLIAHIGKTRNVRAGSIVGSGTVSNRAVEVDGRKAVAQGLFVHCRKARHRDHPGRTALHRLHEVRRHHPHRDEGQGRTERVRRHRPGDCAPAAVRAA